MTQKNHIKKLLFLCTVASMPLITKAALEADFDLFIPESLELADINDRTYAIIPIS